PTPIMHWLNTLDTGNGATDQFNQTVVLQAPTTTTETDIIELLQALLDHHGMLRAHTNPNTWTLTVPQPGTIAAADCLHTATTLDNHTLTTARAQLNPATGHMLRALWIPTTKQLALIIHHLAIDGVSWRIIAEDLNIAWTQHHADQPIQLPPTTTSFPRWAELLHQSA
ncbi:condensation domain-containing protein, partial [Mycobacterium sp. GA-1841]|uniref:condensation domain-containing protein n=1 Tax=Mycobacterium sp. GA-1841 TaxID=1834154 RepID=UPI0020C949FD